MKPPSKVGWLDMIVDDPETTTQFYENVFGLQRKGIEEPNGKTSFALLDDAGKQVLGICDASAFENWVSKWLPYLDVSDYDQSVAQIESSGGTIHSEHQWSFHFEGQRFCLAIDPSGAPIMLCENQQNQA
ncbi:MAG: VOC family protein [Verrucomicrobiota bacterium]